MLLLFFASIGLGLLSYGTTFFLNDRFTLSCIQSPYPATASFIFREQQEIAAIFSRPFYYLNHGSQMYAFESEDGHYILKLIRQERLRLFYPPGFSLLPSFEKNIYREEEESKKEKREKLYQSCRIAWNELRNECGLLCIGLGQERLAPFKITLIDKLGKKWVLPLSSTEFILQKKGDLVGPVMEKLIKEKKFSQAEQRIDQLYSLFLLRCQKGIFDIDASISKNTGFLNNQAIYLDIGGFSKNKRMKNPKIYSQEILKIGNQFTLWLESQNRELGLYSKNWVTTIS